MHGRHFVIGEKRFFTTEFVKIKKKIKPTVGFSIYFITKLVGILDFFVQFFQLFKRSDN